MKNDNDTVNLGDKELFGKGTSMYYVITKGGGMGSAKCLRLLTRGEGGGSRVMLT